MTRKKVYVSSPFKDLEEHRSAVKATLERAGFDVECMEKYPAFDERPKDKCLADVAECDYYVLILAWRYGFQPEDDNPKKLSITHLEYEEAVPCGSGGSARSPRICCGAMPPPRPGAGRCVFCSAPSPARIPLKPPSPVSTPIRDHLEPARLQRDPNPALLFAACLEVAHGRRWNLERFAEPLRRACDHALEHLNPSERAQLWRTLGRLGLDDRPDIGIKDGLPDIAWVEVPAGAFLFGEEKRKKTLPAFRIARYPITNAQYEAFIDDGGYETDAWWEGLAERVESARGFWTDPNQPRETVSWYEAMAYAHWLDARLRERELLPEGRAVRLPTEEEWEKAARGHDGREFPWGEFASGRANINETLDKSGTHVLGQTSAVGLYPAGASPCGALDMAGNVWEWCLNEYEKPGRLAPERDVRRVVRGGSWGYTRGNARCACRGVSSPGSRDDLGLRLVCVAPIA